MADGTRGRWEGTVTVIGLLMAGLSALPFACVIEVPPDDTILNSDVDDGPFVFDAEIEPVVANLPFEKSRLLVQTLPGADGDAVQNAFRDAGVTVIDEIAEIDVAVLETADTDVADAAKRLSETMLFETFQKSYLYDAGIAPNDVLYARQTHLPQIGAERAWDVTTGDQSIVVAIVDTGVDANHPDLKGKIAGGRNIFEGNDRFDDGMGHGTMVAGVAAAASNNALGVTGVAWGSPILAVRVGNAQGLASSQSIAAGILWAVANGAKVINVSFAPLWSDKVVKSAAQQAYTRGALVVISAGNKGGLSTSAGFEEALFVGAIAPDNRIATFSDRGPFVDLVAPGTGIRSTSFDGDYDMASGTSFAAPIVSGVVALAWAANPSFRAVTIRDAILSTALDLGAAGEDDTFGRGAVDAARAVSKAAASFEEVDLTPPAVRIVSPAVGQSMSGRASATVIATDKFGVADVVLSIDGVAYATDPRTPFTFTLDTASFSSGNHELSFIATDVNGNRAAAKTVRVNFVAQTPLGSGSAGTITFTSPAANAGVSGDIAIRASLADADGLAVIEWLVDGQSVFVSPLSGMNSGVSYVWRSDSFPKGSHSITIVATDNLGNQTRGSLILERK